MYQCSLRVKPYPDDHVRLTISTVPSDDLEAGVRAEEGVLRRLPVVVVPTQLPLRGEAALVEGAAEAAVRQPRP